MIKVSKFLSMLTYSFIVATALVFSLCHLRVADGVECPPAEVIQPCHCESAADPVVRCANLLRPDPIRNLTQQSGDSKFRHFFLENSTLTYMPASSLLSISHGLMVINTNMAALFEEMPNSSNTIAVLSLQNVSLQRSIRWEFFQALESLVHLTFVKVERIRALGTEFANNVPSGITHFTLMETGTRHLADRVFEKLKNIYAFYVTNNNIKVLKRSMFAKPCSVRNFIFEGNLIESLPDDIFTDMPFLQTVELQNNRISILAESVFQPVFNQLVVLNVNENPIQCNCTISWLTRSNGQLVRGVCDRPSFMAGIEINALTEEDIEYCQE